MKAADNYLKEKQKTEQKSIQRSHEDSYADFFEIETKERHQFDLNQQRSTFTESVFKGINSEQSVFDKTAVFHTE